jgi:hypothetical protein
MALARSTVDVEPPFGPAVVKRGLVIQYVAQTRSATTGLWSAKDISGSRWTYRLRVWDDDADAAAFVDEAISKGTASSSGELDHYHANGATVYPACTWEIVEVDNSNADTTTTTQFRERVLVRWHQGIEDAP